MTTIFLYFLSQWGQIDMNDGKFPQIDIGYYGGESVWPHYSALIGCVAPL